jgi:hypothetical protein
LDLIAGVGQAPELLSAIRREFVQPNVLIHVSA